MEDDQDVYVQQLREVFDSCDVVGDGLLQRDQLRQLCDKLQLSGQADFLIDQLLVHNPNGQVGFEDFKESFVSVLSETVDTIESSEDDLDQEDDASPKLVKGDKAYGRRSLPDLDESGGSISPSPGLDVGVPPSSRVSSTGLQDIAEDEEVESSRPSDVPPIDTSLTEEDASQGPDMFEAEGQMNQTMTSLEQAGEAVSEEEHLRDIWRELGVGTGGYLSMRELANVCEHIGMDEMNDEELQHLFDKLDTDSDGRVSFDEFLTGLFQHGGSVTPSTPHPRPLSTPRSKLRLSVVNVEDRQTPSFLSVGPGMFSALDVDGSGYATQEAVIEFWEGVGIPQGSEILDYLQFEGGTKVNLSDLSYALEQEMRTVEEDNATYQAAIASLEHELRHQRSVSDHATAERDKLKSDLSEANSRIGLLVKESDERSSQLEKSREKDLLAIERKYQDQIRSLQEDIAGERDSLASQSKEQTHHLEELVDRLKEEEARLKEKLTMTQKEVEKLEKEVLDMVGKNSDLERVVSRQQKDLEHMEEMQKKLDEMEKSREDIITEQQNFSEQKLKQYAEENKELKDKYDELTVEVEELRQASHRRGYRRGRGKDSAHLQKSGSLLSETESIQRSLDEEMSEDELSNYSTDSAKQRRRLPATPDHIADKQAELEATKQELYQMKQDRDDRMHELTRGFSLERKDIEDAFKMEIAQLEDTHMQEKNALIKGFNKVKADIEAGYEEKLAKALEEEREKVRKELEQEREEILVKHESEKNLMELRFAEQKNKLLASLREELSFEMENKLSEQKEKHKIELENSISKDKDDSDDLKQKIADLELRLKLQKEEMELEFGRKKTELLEAFEEEKSEMSEVHRMKILDLEAAFSKGPEHLSGHLRREFEALVERETNRQLEEKLQQERQTMEDTIERQKASFEKQLRDEVEDSVISDRSAMESSLEREKERMEAEMTSSLERERERIEAELEEERDRRDALWKRQKQELLDEIQREKNALSSKYALDQKEVEMKYKRQVEELEDALEQEKQMLDIERERFKVQFKRERDNFDREREKFRQELEDEISQQIQTQMEEEFMAQIDRLKSAFDAERIELQARAKLFESELDELNENREREERERNSARSSAEERHRRQLLEANAGKQELQEKNIKLERDVGDLERQLKRLQVMQEEEVRAMRAETAMAAPSQSSDLILAAIANHSKLLEDKTEELRQDIHNLDLSDPNSASILQLEVDRLVGEKKSLENTLVGMETKMKSLLENSNDAEHYKAKLEKWESEKSALQEQLDITTHKLTEAQTALSLANSAHVREMSEAREKVHAMIDVDKYNDMNTRLLVAERKNRDLEAAMEQRSAETTRLITNTQDDHQRAVQRLQSEKEGIEDRLEITKKLLHEQVHKLKLQLEKGAKTDILVKDLYVENAHLMKCLELTEKREKEAEYRVFNLEDKCKALSKVLHKVAPAALSY